jgi:hypothetical protein
MIVIADGVQYQPRMATGAFVFLESSRALTTPQPELFWSCFAGGVQYPAPADCRGFRVSITAQSETHAYSPPDTPRNPAGRA